MVTVLKLGLMDQVILEISVGTKNKEKEHSLGLTTQGILEISSMIFSMEMVSTFGQTEDAIKDSGVMVKYTVTENLHGQIRRNISVYE